MSTTEVEAVDDYETLARVALMIADAAEALSTVLAGVADMLAGVVVRPGSPVRSRSEPEAESPFPDRTPSVANGV